VSESRYKFRSRLPIATHRGSCCSETNISMQLSFRTRRLKPLILCRVRANKMGLEQILCAFSVCLEFLSHALQLFDIDKST
jgi:hypothetical protein